MTIELTYLAATLILALVQIMLPAAGRTAKYGLKWNAGPRDADVPPPGRITGRLERAQANLYETLPLFIGAVLIYIPLYAFGVPFVRSLVWLVSLIGLIMILAALFI